jgi:hypothetical protein
MVDKWFVWRTGGIIQRVETEIPGEKTVHLKSHTDYDRTTYPAVKDTQQTALFPPFLHS